MNRINTSIACRRQLVDEQQIIDLAQNVFTGVIDEKTILRNLVRDQRALIAWLMSPELSPAAEDTVTRLYHTIDARSLALTHASSLRQLATEEAPVEGAYL